MREKVIAIYDVGKTNKKIILFDFDLKPVYEIEEKFTEIKDDDGFECDDIDRIENWIKESIRSLIYSDKFEVTAINFATYGATLVYLDKNGKRLTPVYNYLKPIDDRIPEKVYRKNGGQDEFCRRTASPALGMLNSGMQALWLKYTKPQIFTKVAHILHFPQYLSYLLTGKIYSEHTSIGCHTAMWDFDEMKYHQWVKTEGLRLPLPVDINTINDAVIEGKTIKTGIGIHDSSASLAPYLLNSEGRFILISTGTWCINMNPFNNEKLTADQLDKDCLCYMSIKKQPVKSSRLFLGHFHETIINKLNEHFNVEPGYYKKVQPDQRLLELCIQRSKTTRFFFDNFPYSRTMKGKFDLYAFRSFEEGYHQLMVELSEMAVEAIDLVIPDDNDVENIYLTGGFSKNKLFLKLLANAYHMKNLYTSEVFNATALGAALVIMDSLSPGSKPVLNLGLTRL
jgi:sugar (pentulose or hexulose) kinase